MIFEEAGVYQFGVVHNNELLLPYEDDFFITLTFLCVAVVVHIYFIQRGMPPSRMCSILAWKPHTIFCYACLNCKCYMTAFN